MCKCMGKARTDLCFYCGLLATTIDHVIPRSLITRLDPAEAHDARYRWVVPACSECNSLLSDRIFDRLATRRVAAHEAIRRRYAKLLASPDWAPTELEDLGPTLRSHVERCQRLRELIRARLRWPL